MQKCIVMLVYFVLWIFYGKEMTCFYASIKEKYTEATLYFYR